jgi:LPPG:FO 2-phospho-L-lactate transferase
MRVVLLAGGTGGGKLAAGLQDVLGADLTVVANTADDVDMHGLRVSPDPDLCTYWLTGQIDEDRGWGIKDDGFTVAERLELLGAPGWFKLSDRDLATCLYRTHFLAEGGSLTAAQAQIAQALGAEARVLPMCEERVGARVLTASGWRGLQEFLILDQGAGPVEDVELTGIESARATPEVRDAIAAAEVIVIGPSNPVISIGPILATAGVLDAIKAADAPVVAVSPLVAGKSLKGPTEAFLRAVGRSVDARGVASLYAGLLDGMVVDGEDPGPPPENVAVLTRPTLMSDARTRRRHAEATLDFARDLRAG